MKEPARFGHFRERAQDLVESRERLQSVVQAAVKKLARASGGKLAEAKDELTTLVALLRAWLAGDYREISNRTLVVAAAAVLYFVVPLDAIPDFLFGWGLLDDVAVIGYVFNQIKDEIEAFRQWQADTSEQISEQTEAQTEEEREEEVEVTDATDTRGNDERT